MNSIVMVFDIIRRCPQHVFQVLTKRPDRVAELDADLDWPNNLWMGVTVEDSTIVHRIDLPREDEVAADRTADRPKKRLIPNPI